MFENSEIKSITPNTEGRAFLSIWNRIVNLSHVTEIIINSDPQDRNITIKFVNGSEATQKFDSQTYLSHAYKTLLHCIKNNIFDIEFTNEHHIKWAQYNAEESNRKKYNS